MLRLEPQYLALSWAAYFDLMSADRGGGSDAQGSVADLYPLINTWLGQGETTTVDPWH